MPKENTYYDMKEALTLEVLLLHLVLMLCLIYLCEYLLELLELSRSIWFSFCPHAFYSCILLRVHSIHIYLIYFTFTKSVAINQDLSQPLSYKKVRE